MSQTLNAAIAVVGIDIGKNSTRSTVGEISLMVANHLPAIA
jgi:hypothetical protein